MGVGRSFHICWLDSDMSSILVEDPSAMNKALAKRISVKVAL